MRQLLTTAAALTLSLNAMAFGLPKVEVPSVSTDAQNMIAALQVIQDGGVECSEITDFKLASNVKGYQVECDNQKSYTLLDTNNGLVLQVK
ncbi:hypothetical protein [Vibrio gigantis]|uniref:hypothetical protein n=1 Tax=Vibrio gigantis TaxID=296199 RepID=UPI001BFEDF13|nr:hypothetical protein [Vibrio gigantis]